MLNIFAFYQIKKIINQIYYLYQDDTILYLIPDIDSQIKALSSEFMVFLYADKKNDCLHSLNLIREILLSHLMLSLSNNNIDINKHNINFTLINKFFPITIKNEVDYYTDKLRQIELIKFWLNIYK